jgi:competence protein ComEC
MNALLTLVSGFASGVFLRSLFSSAGLLAITFLFIFGCAVVAYRWKGMETYRLTAIFCAFVVLGSIRMHYAESPLPKLFSEDLRQRVVYTGTVTSDPDIREKNQRVPIRVTHGDETTIILAVAELTPIVEVGDRVQVSGILARPQPFNTEGGRVFRYDKYLEKDGIRFLLNFATLQLVEPAPWYSPPASLARIKHGFLRGLESTLPKESAALAGGIVIGGRTGLSQELRDSFITSGLVHVIVLSGYNVMIVAEWMMALLALLTTSRRIRAVAGALALLLFVGIAGFSATAIRATLMALIALYARATGRTYTASRALFAAILLMLIWNPLYLVYDPGFGLSVAATAGLIWLSPLFEGALSRTRVRLGRGEPNKIQLFWIQAVATTLAAQTGVLPLLLYNTGNLSLVALPANLLVVAVTPLAMAAAALAGVGGALFASTLTPLGEVLSVPADLLTRYIIFIATESAALPGAALILPAFSFAWVVAAYAALTFIASSKRFSTTDQLTLAKKAST